jgi:hypothetical protein
MSHEFTEDVADGSMCICGVPALTHYLVEEAWQEPNIRAANEHLHRQLAAKDARIRELESEVLGLRTEADDSEDMAKYWHRKFQELNAQMNGEAA